MVVKYIEQVESIIFDYKWYIVSGIIGILGLVIYIKLMGGAPLWR